MPLPLPTVQPDPDRLPSGSYRTSPEVHFNFRCPNCGEDARDFEGVIWLDQHPNRVVNRRGRTVSGPVASFRLSFTLMQERSRFASLGFAVWRVTLEGDLQDATREIPPYFHQISCLNCGRILWDARAPGAEPLPVGEVTALRTAGRIIPRVLTLGTAEERIALYTNLGNSVVFRVPRRPALSSADAETCRLAGRAARGWELAEWTDAISRRRAQLGVTDGGTHRRKLIIELGPGGITNVLTNDAGLVADRTLEVHVLEHPLLCESAMTERMLTFGVEGRRARNGVLYRLPVMLDIATVDGLTRAETARLVALREAQQAELAGIRQVVQEATHVATEVARRDGPGEPMVVRPRTPASAVAEAVRSVLEDIQPLIEDDDDFHYDGPHDEEDDEDDGSDN